MVHHLPVLCFVVVLVFVDGRVVFPHGLASETRGECGRRRTDLLPIGLTVIGGEEIARGNSPWSVLLGYKRSVYQGVDVVCIQPLQARVCLPCFPLFRISDNPETCSYSWTLCAARLGHGGGKSRGALCSGPWPSILYQQNRTWRTSPNSPTQGRQCWITYSSDILLLTSRLR